MRMKTARGGIEPFYFGTLGKTLFGCYHAPQSECAQDCGVVICPPLGREYIASHHASQQLAVRLAGVGFHVLRFDFFGCGDSSGDCEEARIHQWLGDISTATHELRRRGNLFKICLMGIRLGGTLSLMAGADDGDIECLVLWDPVIRGKVYLEELLTLNRAQPHDTRPKPHDSSTANDSVEVSGFAFDKLMLGELARIDLLATRRKPANNILIIESSEETRGRELRDRLHQAGINVEYQQLIAPSVWVEHGHRISNAVALRRIPRTIVSWLSRTHQ